MSPDPAKAVPELDENGIDLSEIRENLKLTVEQRLRKAEMRAREAIRAGRTRADDDKALYYLLAIKKIREEKSG